MPSDAAQTLYEVLLVDSVIVGLVICFFWVGVFVARRFRYAASYGLGALGLTKPGPGYSVAAFLGIVTGVGALFLSFLTLPLSTYAVEWLGYSAERSVQEPLMQGLGDWIGENPGTAIPATIFVVVLFAPAVEEIIFRGAIFGGLYALISLLFRRLGGGGKGRLGDRISFTLAAIVSSTAFALLHLEPVLLPTLFVLAIVLCALYRRTGSLLAPFLAHATFNSFATLLIILSGLDLLPMPV